MKKILIYLVCLITLSHTQAQSWESLNVEALALNRKKQYDKAIEVGQKALKVAETQFGVHHIKYAASLLNLGNLHKDHNNRRKQTYAETYYKQTFEFFTKHLEYQGHTIEGNLNFNYGLYLEKFNQNPKQYYQRAYEVYRKSLGEQHQLTQTAKKKL